MSVLPIWVPNLFNHELCLNKRHNIFKDGCTIYYNIVLEKKKKRLLLYCDSVNLKIHFMGSWNRYLSSPYAFHKISPRNLSTNHGQTQEIKPATQELQIEASSTANLSLSQQNYPYLTQYKTPQSPNYSKFAKIQARVKFSKTF